jgi:hypothetical protein
MQASSPTPSITLEVPVATLRALPVVGHTQYLHEAIAEHRLSDSERDANRPLHGDLGKGWFVNSASKVSAGRSGACTRRELQVFNFSHHRRAISQS